MNATQLLHDLGQSLGLDNMTRDLLDSGRAQRYVVAQDGGGPRITYGAPGSHCPAAGLTSAALPARTSAVTVPEFHPPPRARYSPTILSRSSRWSSARFNSASNRSRSASSTCK